VPPLSGIDLPLPEMAEAAIELLLRRIGNDTGAHEERLIPGGLIERGSLAVPGPEADGARRL
jgi:DNA-binding LacI/PurR family transcriptional regulator